MLKIVMEPTAIRLSEISFSGIYTQYRVAFMLSVRRARRDIYRSWYVKIYDGLRQSLLPLDGYFGCMGSLGAVLS
jgi:hypothetical protein